MSDPAWGMLSKSQDNPETIEQCIARLIAEHNNNEAAHLAEGQSLSSHKASEIIDHLARSVWRDKLAFDRFQIDDHFDTIDTWGKSANVFLDNIGQVSLSTTNVTNNRQNFYIIAGDATQEAGLIPTNPIFETRVKLSHAVNQNAYIIHGDPDVPAGVGFKIVNGSLYAVWFDGASAEHTQAITGVTVTNWNLYRVEIVDGVNIKFYVNGILKYTSVDFDIADTNTFMYYSIKTTTTSSRVMWVQSLHYDEDYSQ